MKHYSCPKCQSRLSFDALSCWHCETELGYVFNTDSMVSMWNLPTAVPCVNRDILSCNWIVDPATNGGGSLCPSCRYTRTIPPQHDAENREAWKKLEHAKRSLLYSLRSLGLSPPDRIQQPATGLAFDFLTPLPDQPAVLTAHASGVITVNISEADDVRREQRRASLNEPYRTLLGHLRHEVGHFYWDQLIANSTFLEPYRQCFGDERQNYDQALQSYYNKATNREDWRDDYVSRYASSHPWEDWAETWAYYLHIRDALDTAAAWRVSVSNENLTQQQMTPVSNGAFYSQITSTWPELCEYLNAALRSAGVSGEYPYKLSEPVINKLGFVHQVITDSACIEHHVGPVTAAAAQDTAHYSMPH